MVDLAEVVDDHDVRVHETPGGAGLPQEPLGAVRVVAVRDRLDRDRPAHPRVEGLPHHAEPASSELLDQSVPPVEHIPRTHTAP